MPSIAKILDIVLLPSFNLSWIEMVVLNLQAVQEWYGSSSWWEICWTRRIVFFLFSIAICIFGTLTILLLHLTSNLRCVIFTICDDSDVFWILIYSILHQIFDVFWMLMNLNFRASCDTEAKLYMYLTVSLRNDWKYCFPAGFVIYIYMF